MSDQGRSSRTRTPGGERNELSRTRWTRDELSAVLDLFLLLNGQGIHERNPDIHKLAARLGRTVRSVEGQLLMFRNLQKCGNYSFGNMNKVCVELWQERNLSRPLQDMLMDRVAESNNAQYGADGPINSTVTLLLSRHHGGETAANVPGLTNSTSSLFFDGPPSAGVTDVFQYFESKLITQTLNTPLWLFLVGGPGNGKSYQLDNLLTRLKAKASLEIFTSGRLASRYLADNQQEITVNGNRVRVINDASIRSGALSPDRPGHLVEDMLAALRSPDGAKSSMLVNINRGVMIDDIAHTVKADSDYTPYLELLNWLLHSSNSRSSEFINELPESSPYFACADFTDSKSDSGSVRILKLSLDNLSLLELSPKLETDEAVRGLDGEQVQTAPYRLMPFNSDERIHSPAGVLLTKLVAERSFEDDSCSRCPAKSLCPILANAKTLRDTAVKAGFLRIVRATEIATSRQFTYRDFWTIFCVAIIGRVIQPFKTGQHPCNWVQNKVSQLESGFPEDGQSLASLSALVQQRVHNSLWHSYLPSNPFGCKTKRSVPPLPPSLKFMWMVDPSRDVSDEWAAVVNEAMESYNFDIGPIEHLDEKLPSTSIHELDRRFESALSEWLKADHLAVNKRASVLDVREHLRWLGAGYYRLYGIVCGRPSMPHIYKQWVTLYNHVASTGVAPVGSEIAKAIKRLILPEVGQDVAGEEGYLFLPLFSPRVDPLRSAPASPIIVAAIPLTGQHQGRVKFEVDGDSLRAKLELADELLNDTLLPLDYANCREALASAYGHGFTDAAGTTVPRVERIRASLVRNANRLQVVIVDDKAYPVM